MRGPRARASNSHAHSPAPRPSRQSNRCRRGGRASVFRGQGTHREQPRRRCPGDQYRHPCRWRETDSRARRWQGHTAGRARACARTPCDQQNCQFGRPGVGCVPRFSGRSAAEHRQCFAHDRNVARCRCRVRMANRGGKRPAVRHSSCGASSWHHGRSGGSFL